MAVPSGPAFPAAPSNAPPRPPRNRRPWVIAGVGCLVLLLLACGGAGLFAFRTFNSLNIAAASPPADFPVYPGARQQSALAIRPSGSTGPITSVQWVTSDSSATVVDFYRTNLDRPPWRLLAERPVAIAQLLTFEDTGRARYGQVQVQSILNKTTIQLTIGNRTSYGTLPSSP